ncbi:unnamed protein product [Cuscuta epithymum]|uniref:Uncharacterized protein n=1 Tax=Cuscuta epithymum TaxID=186058 RepID=A0AAV0FK81_9ASTE|nr:unnamed protein product [Cuscuta epithymum]
MAAIEVLYPQDPLHNRSNRRHTSLVNAHMKPKRNPSSNPNPISSRGTGKSDRRKRSPQKNGSTDSCNSGGLNLSNSPPVKKAAMSNLIMGQVKILKRGETLTNTASLVVESKKAEIEPFADSLEKELVLSTISRLGPEPERMLNEIKIGDFYAGLSVATPPPPSSLPLPSFTNKNILGQRNGDATSDIRRFLRLNMC